MQFIGEFEHSRSPRALAGVQGRSPCTKKRRGAVSEGGTPSDARRKPQENWLYRITYGQWICQKSIGSQRFSCTYRCAPRRFPTSRTTDKCCFSDICRPQPVTPNICLLSCCGGRPRHYRPSVLGSGGKAPRTPRIAATPRADKPKFEHPSNHSAQNRKKEKVKNPPLPNRNITEALANP